MKKIILMICLLWGNQIYAQFTVSGKVTNESDEPVENANVQISGTRLGDATDSQGRFVINDVPAGDHTLLITHVSYSPNTSNISVSGPVSVEIRITGTIYMSDVVIEATRASNNTPTTYQNLDEEELATRNFGQDIPVMLELTPSVVSTSDAGAGVGYTGIRIRGTDATRINVTINGVPVNDSESHGVYWVNTPDLVSSTSSIQIQRGVGASTNGAGAFGASINLLTNDFEEDPYGEINTTAGSFKTWKNTLRFGTGLINDTWSFDGRLSSISSDGYIDRASSDLGSYYLSGLYAGDKTTLKLITFAGHERTYQAWWGTPEARLDNDVAGMNLVADYNYYTQEQRDNLLNSGRTFNYYQYENEVDDYRQDHYQAHMSSELGTKTQLNLALHYTYGRGFYEQYRMDDNFEDYDITPIDTQSGQISTTDLVRRRWLENHFYGTTFSLIHQSENLELTWGGAANKYKGDHFGEVIWAQYAVDIPKDYKYYNNSSEKSDINTYLKVSYRMGSDLWAYGDLQVRSIAYTAQGPDNDRVGGVPQQINVDENYTFFNPKVGITWKPNPGTKMYASFAVAHREPVRSDFTDNQNGNVPEPEVLRNFEIGTIKRTGELDWSANLYYMDYRDQLVLTGELNDVGSPIRANVARSYRAGLELILAYHISDNFDLGGNATFSQNKIRSFDEYLYDYGVNWDEYNAVITSFDDTDIAFSPSLISSTYLEFYSGGSFNARLTGKYVGMQYLDNTANPERSIDAYFVGYLNMGYSWHFEKLKELRVGLLINNLFNRLYENNGYTFGYRGGGDEIRENYYYPQAERNFLISLNLKF